MALKIRNQLTRKTYKGVQKLTKGHMVIRSKYVAGQVLEHTSGLAFQVYDCCLNSCVCFAGEFESLTVCLLCSKPRYDSQQKAQNQFRYIPIIPCLQVMFREQDVIELLHYRLQCKAHPNRINDMWDGMNLQELLNKNIKINGQLQGYTYGELDTDIFLTLTCNGISIHKGIGAQHSKTEYACFLLELIILNLPPEVQTQDCYVYSLDIIPGPHEPKHLDSFCWLFYLECMCRLQGIQTYNS